MSATVTTALPAIFDGQALVKDLGLPLLLVIVFAETGLLVGFFLPGDSLLFAAGYAASGGISGVDTPPIAVVCLLMTLVAFVGAQVGFFLGRKAGPTLFARQDSRLFKRSNVARAEEFLDEYGAPKAIVLSRFVPVVRTFMNPLAGALEVPVRVFATWNLAVSVVWGTGVTLLGYFLGQVSFIGKNIEAFALLVVVISLVPFALEILKRRRAHSPKSSSPNT